MEKVKKDLSYCIKYEVRKHKQRPIPETISPAPTNRNFSDLKDRHSSKEQTNTLNRFSLPSLLEILS